MSGYSRGLMLAVVLHVLFLLLLTTVNWPQQQHAGWQQVRIVQSYLFKAHQIQALAHVVMPTNAPRSKSRGTPRSKSRGMGNQTDHTIYRSTKKENRSMVSHALVSRKNDIASSISKFSIKSANPSVNASANVSKGQYDRLLILLHNAIAEKQVYPENAEMLGQKGIVSASFILARSGAISAITIKKSSGFNLLDQAAIAAIQQISPFTAVKLTKNLVFTVAIKFE